MMTPQTSTLILGLGNELVSDDGFGPAVAQACRAQFADRGEVHVESAAAAGLNLLALLEGCERAVIIDVVQTGKHAPGTLMDWPLESASAGRTLGGSHQMDLMTTLELGRRVGQYMPRSIRLLVAEAKDLATIHEGLSPELAAAVPQAVARLAEWLEGPPQG
jgi:hydrogenase maturation protease